MCKAPGWQNYNDDCLECYFLSRKKIYHFQENYFQTGNFQIKFYCNQDKEEYDYQKSIFNNFNLFLVFVIPASLFSR